MSENPIAAGSSSFDLVDRGVLFRALGIESGETVLDLACGRGNYSLALSPLVGEKGVLYAVDLWEEGIAALAGEASHRGMGNIRPLVADVSRRIPLGDGSVSLCLMATVLHDLIEDGTAEGTLGEVRRVVGPGGRLAVVEFKVMEGPPGPPRKVRISREKVEELAGAFGFSAESSRDLGPQTYLVVLRKSGG